MNGMTLLVSICSIKNISVSYSGFFLTLSANILTFHLWGMVKSTRSSPYHWEAVWIDDVEIHLPREKTEGFNAVSEKLVGLHSPKFCVTQLLKKELDNSSQTQTTSSVYQYVTTIQTQTR